MFFVRHMKESDSSSACFDTFQKAHTAAIDKSKCFSGPEDDNLFQIYAMNDENLRHALIFVDIDFHPEFKSRMTYSFMREKVEEAVTQPDFYMQTRSGLLKAVFAPDESAAPDPTRSVTKDYHPNYYHPLTAYERAHLFAFEVANFFAGVKDIEIDRNSFVTKASPLLERVIKPQPTGISDAKAILSNFRNRVKAEPGIYHTDTHCPWKKHVSPGLYVQIYADGGLRCHACRRSTYIEEDHGFSVDAITLLSRGVSRFSSNGATKLYLPAHYVQVRRLLDLCKRKLNNKISTENFAFPNKDFYGSLLAVACHDPVAHAEGASRNPLIGSRLNNTCLIVEGNSFKDLLVPTDKDGSKLSNVSSLAFKKDGDGVTDVTSFNYFSRADALEEIAREEALVQQANPGAVPPPTLTPVRRAKIFAKVGWVTLLRGASEASYAGWLKDHKAFINATDNIRVLKSQHFLSDARDYHYLAHEKTLVICEPTVAGAKVNLVRRALSQPVPELFDKVLAALKKMNPTFNTHYVLALILAAGYSIRYSSLPPEAPGFKRPIIEAVGNTRSGKSATHLIVRAIFGVADVKTASDADQDKKRDIGVHTIDSVLFAAFDEADKDESSMEPGKRKSAPVQAILKTEERGLSYRKSHKDNETILCDNTIIITGTNSIRQSAKAAADQFSERVLSFELHGAMQKGVQSLNVWREFPEECADIVAWSLKLSATISDKGEAFKDYVKRVMPEIRATSDEITNEVSETTTDVRLAFLNHLLLKHEKDKSSPREGVLINKETLFSAIAAQEGDHVGKFAEIARNLTITEGGSARTTTDEMKDLAERLGLVFPTRSHVRFRVQRNGSQFFFRFTAHKFKDNNGKLGNTFAQHRELLDFVVRPSGDLSEADKVYFDRIDEIKAELAKGETL